MATRLGLKDCTKIANCPFSKDGRVAFVDTQTFNKPPVRYYKLIPYLTTKKREYWKKLNSKEKERKKDRKEKDKKI